MDNLGTIIFSALVAATVLVIILTSAHYLNKMRGVFRRLHHDLRLVSSRITEIKSCDINNLAQVSRIVAEDGFELLNSATEQLTDDAERLYQNKWITKPAHTFTFDNLLNKQQYTLFTLEIPLQLIAISMLLSAIFWLCGFSFLSGNSSLVLSLSGLPVIIACFFALLLTITVLHNKQQLHQDINYLSEVITRRVPVFEELAGTAVLVDSFVRYDREMNESVAFLAESVDKLTHHELADKVSENIRAVMSEEIAPAYQKAANALVALAEELQAKQSQGMAELAHEFTQQVGRTLNVQLEAFYRELNILIENMQKSSGDIDLAIKTIEQAKADQLELQQNTQIALEQLAVTRNTWQEDMRVNTESVHSLAETAAHLEAIYNGEQNQLNHRLEDLSNELHVFSAELAKLLTTLEKENNNTGTIVNSLENSNNRLLSEVRQLSMEMTQSADIMTRQSSQINDSLASLNENLNTSINQFSYQLQAGVKNTLNEFDESLAEISLRLANTTAEIKDSAQSISNSLRTQNQPNTNFSKSNNTEF